MEAGFSEDQELIRSTARSFLQDWKAAGGFRALTDNQRRRDNDAWAIFARELGFAGLSIPEKCGGAGLGDIERVLLMEEMGQVLFMSPYFSTCVLAADLLQQMDHEIAREELEAIASGQRLATVAKLDTGFQASKRGVTGAARNVIDGECAERVILIAGDEVHIASGDCRGLSAKKSDCLDLTRPVADLELDCASTTRIARGELATQAIRRAEARSAIALASEQLGGAEQLLSSTVEYTLQRKQFGRSVGSFQAVKHKCADMMVAIEAARSATYLAAAMADTDELVEHAAIAKSEASDTYFKVAGDAIQMHGGVGVTWEYDLHFHFKRARAGRSLLGTPQAWREKLAEIIAAAGGPL